MKKRDFIKLVGAGVAGSSLPASVIAQEPQTPPPPQTFNMCGYGAPKIDTVRIGYIGLGNRGLGALDRIVYIDNVEIKALCDIRTERTDLAKKKLQGTSHAPQVYAGKADDWKKLCERPDL
ncbi:MAG TPA: acetylgalactosaminidase, partial [Runella sp.]|nr:acetylgalactosaminidase [Runella sp.]